MSNHFMFLGDPGPDARAMLEVLRNIGLSAKRAEISDDLMSKLSESPPGALLVDSNVETLSETIASVRQDRVLSGIPILLRVTHPDPTLLAKAFKWGVDDYYVDGAVEQFGRLVSAIEKQESWKTVRAPAGKVILAHGERLERAQFGRILRRNGFDTYFAGNTDELETACVSQDARAIIVSLDLPGIPVLDIVAKLAGEVANLPPFVFVVRAELLEKTRDNIPAGICGKLFDADSDVEGITFVLNELLAPPPTGVRRSPRVLYGTPVAYVHEGGDMSMNGFVYNINYGGIYIRTLASLPLQTKISVTFRPPFGRGQVFADAQVVWRKQLGDTAGAASPPGMGIQFLDLWQADLAAYETGYNLLLEKNESSTSLPAPTPIERNVVKTE